MDEVLDAVGPALDGRADAVFLDATTGGAGHSRAVIEQLAPARAVCFDRDAEALAAARAHLELDDGDRRGPTRVTLVHAPFSEIDAQLDALGIDAVDAMLADIGVSSHQLDTAARGFSFQSTGPLDMRMDPSRGRPASAQLAEIEVGALTKILRDLGEEPDARRIAQAIVEARPETTAHLARVVTEAMSHRQRRNLGARIHPATRTFQAIRIWVNGELDELDALLDRAPERLSVGGRLAIISFHSLEDRRVKRRFKALTSPPPVPRGLPIRDDELPRPRFCTPRPFSGGRSAAEDEVARNPRSRSARLRVIQRDLP